MIERDVAILRELQSACRDLTWARPMDVGGRSNSDHSYRLSKLSRQGYVEARQRSLPGLRGSKEYRLTELGEAACECCRKP